MTLASIKKRILATAIDLIIFAILFIIFYLIVSSQYQTFQGQSGAGYSYSFPVPTYIFLTVLICWIIFITLTEFKNGQSIGKRILKIKVIKQDYDTANIVNTFLRHLFDIVDLTLLAGLVVALTNKKQKRIGDFIARTIVVTI